MNILEQIVEKTKLRIDKLKSSVNVNELKDSASKIHGGAFSFEEALKTEDISFICEIKKASPSKGIIAGYFPYIDIAKEYEQAGASAISVLTEPDFFLGSCEYLKEISKTVNIPLLRKDFIIDELQIYESKIIGANAILLICSLLDEETLKDYITIADSLGLSCLIEAHNENEIQKAIKSKARIIGVNNRDLKTFNVDIQNSINLRKLVPPDILFVSESGIKTKEQIDELRQNNVNAVLIGETFMKSKDKKRELAILKNGVQ
ncbi:MAG: indole-3-glycerol phosphate synthase TrpC [Candidatus Gastranaerophilales bacterium]|nr:indole-3-glycerol phosphate synthase TrpC [Candidatus Gastranaerophilales bacterium]